MEPEYWQQPTEANLTLIQHGPLADLWLQLSDRSHQEFCFLDPLYSPTSCVPCADLTPFIVQRLRENDLASVQGLMRFIVDGNPPLLVGAGANSRPSPEWVDAPVAEIARLNWARYCQSDDSTFELELKALLIMGISRGITHEGWVASQEPALFALALCCHDIRWRTELRELADRANRFILEMRANLPFWREIPLLELKEAPFPGNVSAAARLLASVPVLSRVPLLAMLEKRNAAPLVNVTTYAMRQLGIHMRDAAPELIASGLCEPVLNLDAVASLYTKSDLLAVMAAHSIPSRKSWNKRKLIETLATTAPGIVAEAAECGKVARVAPRYVPGLLALRCYATVLRDYIRPIGFALSKPTSW